MCFRVTKRVRWGAQVAQLLSQRFAQSWGSPVSIPAPASVRQVTVSAPGVTPDGGQELGVDLAALQSAPSATGLFLKRRVMQSYSATSAVSFSDLCGVFVSRPGVAVVASVTTCSTGAPVPNAELLTFSSQRYQYPQTLTYATSHLTNTSGLALLYLAPAEVASWSGVVVARVPSTGDMVFWSNVELATPLPTATTTALLVTDRAVYKPGTCCCCPWMTLQLWVGVCLLCVQWGECVPPLGISLLCACR